MRFIGKWMSKRSDISSVKFDFLFINGGRAASRALNLFLSVHPSIHLVPRLMVDTEVLKGRIERLRRTYSEYRCLFPDAKIGLIHHAVRPLLKIDRKRRSQNTKLVAQIAAQVQAQGFFQVVREPFAAVCSEVNHRIMMEVLGDYKFEALSLPWLTEFNLKDLPIYSEMEPARAPDFGPIRATNVDRLLAGAAQSTGRNHQIGMIYAKYFDAWHVVDSSLIYRGKDKIARIFELLGVDRDFDSDIFDIPAHNIASRFMYNNPFLAHFEDCKLLFCLSYSAIPPRSEEEGIVKWISVAETGPVEGIYGLAKMPLALWVRALDFYALPNHIIAFIRKAKVLERLLQKVVLPLWVSNAQLAIPYCRSHFISSLTDAQREYFLRQNGGDIRAFVDRHSHVKEFWKNDYRP